MCSKEYKGVRTTFKASNGGSTGAKFNGTWEVSIRNRFGCKDNSFRALEFHSMKLKEFVGEVQQAQKFNKGITDEIEVISHGDLGGIERG